MERSLIIMVCCLAVTMAVEANSMVSCEDYKGALGLIDAAGSIDNKSYDISADYFSGGPLYSIRRNNETGDYTFYPLKNVFQISNNNAATLLITNHWCLNENGEMSSEWVYGECGCESLYGGVIYSEDYDSSTDYSGIMSQSELGELSGTFSLSSDYSVSTSAYDTGCNMNNAIAWFRFQFAAENPEDRLPPRVIFEDHSVGDIYKRAILKSCSEKETLVYKIWTECDNELGNEIFFENMSDPVVIDYDSVKEIAFNKDYQCTAYALTNDPFKNIISFPTVSEDGFKSKTGSEQPVLEQSGADIRIGPSSQVWWSASPAYRAKKLDDRRYEVIILKTPFLDECVPAGEYIYFFTDHNCSDAEAKCLNYAGISIVENDLNKNCPEPETSAIVLESELKPVFISKPFLAQKNPPSYNTFFNSCTILPGEILKRQKENSIEEMVPQRMFFNLKDDVLDVGNCGEKILEVQKVKRDCTDDRKSKSFYSITTDPWKIGSEEVVTVDLIDEEEEGCYYDCNVSVLSNDPDNQTLSFPFQYGKDAVRNSGITSNINTNGESFKVIQGKEAVMEITIENKDCLEMTDPQIYLSPNINSDNYEDLPSLNLIIISNSVKIIDSPAGFDINPDTGGTRIYLSGKLAELEKVKISFKVIVTMEGGCSFDEGYYWLDYSFKHKDLKKEVYIKQGLEFYCSEKEDESDKSDKSDESNESSDMDNSSVKDENGSSGCAMGL